MLVLILFVVFSRWFANSNKVADESFAGTDCDVKLTLKNRGKPFTCQTMTLGGNGNNWEGDHAEDYKKEDFRLQFLP